MSIELWAPTNKTLFSSVFTVPPMKVCLLFGANFELEKFRVDASEFVSPQAVCVRRVMHGFVAPDVSRESCGWVFDIDSVRADMIVDEVVTSCGAPWQLTLCRNIGIIGLPGSYRLELNDSTALGKLQVYAELYDADSFPTQIKDLFFA